MKKYVTMVFFVFIIQNTTHAGISTFNYLVKIFPFSDKEYFVCWKLNVADEDVFVGRFVNNEGITTTDRMRIYGVTSLAFNSKKEFINLRQFEYPGTEEWPSSFTLYAKIFRSPTDTTNAIFLNGDTWPECGMGFLGFEKMVKGLSDDFLYLHQYDGSIGLRRFDPMGNTIFNMWWKTNSINISLAALSDSSYMVASLSMKTSEQDSIPISIYLTHFERRNQIVQDSIVIKRYPQLSDSYLYFDYNRIPDVKISSINDSIYQLFVLEKDTLRLLSYLLDKSGRVREQEMIDLKPSSYADTVEVFENYEFNLSNFAGNSRTMFISGRINEEDPIYNYLIYFDRQGKFTGDKIIDTCKYVFKSEDFKCKTGETTFFNGREFNGDIVLKQYTNFQQNGSFKIGTISSLANKKENVPEKIALFDNYPNPFGGVNDPVTTIQYDIPTKNYVKLVVYDILGRKVKELVDKEQPGGRYRIKFDAAGLPSGIYFYRLWVSENGPELLQTKRMLLIK